MNETNLTGKASVDKPWLAIYPEAVQHLQYSYDSLADYLKKSNTDHDQKILDYYGCRMSLNDIFNQVDKTAKALKAVGVKERDCIVSFLHSVPSFIFLLLAVEQIGAEILCRDNLPHENFEAIEKSKATLVFAHDYLSVEDTNLYYSCPSLKHIVLVSPYIYADTSKLPFHIKDNIESRYPFELTCNPGNITWEEFIKQGESYTGSYHYPYDCERPFYKTYTSGSTGPSKQVIHSVKTVLGVIAPMTLLTPRLNFEYTSLLSVLPPALIAVVGPMMLYRLATNVVLILDPYCDMEDLDLEIMRYKPNSWNAIPQLANMLVQSKRIPKDYSLEFIYQIGGGADPMNNKQLRNVQNFLKEHKSPAIFTMGYGMSEAAAVITCPIPGVQHGDCSTGMPMIGVTVGVFDEGTQRELGYREIGEICSLGPGNMLGYDDEESTAEVLQMHPDGERWLHTGDYGYITETGEVFVLSRGLTKRYNGGYLFPILMENNVVDIPGIKDGFFVVVQDRVHKGYGEPHLYLVLEEGVTLDQVEPVIREKLQSYEYPVKINIIKKRQYFHFKTNRRQLAQEIMREYEDEKNNLVEEPKQDTIVDNSSNFKFTLE